MWLWAVEAPTLARQLTDSQMAVRMSALHADTPRFTSGKFLVLFSVSGEVAVRAVVQLEDKAIGPVSVPAGPTGL
jgi:hypothetical protein